MIPLSTSEQLSILRNEAVGVSVLYVEDEAKLREQVALYLKKIFTDVTVCSDGIEGLEAYRSNRFDLVITDILMPRMNGLDMLKEIKEIHPRQKSVIVSAYTENNYFMEATKLGVDAYILKPINHPQIVESLYKVVSKITQQRFLMP